MKVVPAGTPVSPLTPNAGELAKQAVVAKIQAMRDATPGYPKSTIQTQAEALINKAPQLPVNDPNHVTPEELGSLKVAEKKEEIAEQIGQNTNAEASPAEETPKVAEAAPEETPLSAQYAQLARKEKAMRQEAQRLKAERQALENERNALKTPPPPVYDPNKHIDRQRLIEDPLNTLADLGLTYDQLVQAQLNAPSPESMQLNRTIKALETKIAQLEEGQNKTNKSFEEQQQNSYKQALNQIGQEAKKLIYTDPNFETIKATNNVKEVVKLIEDTWKEEGRLMTVEEACDEVENYLVEEATKIAQLKKIQSRLKPAAVPASEPAKRPAEVKDTKKQQTTLTNSMTTARNYTAKERAILAAQYGPNWRSKVS